MILSRKLVALFALSGLLASCGGGEDAQVVLVELIPNAVKINEVGAEFTLGAVGKSSNGATQTSLAEHFNWSSSDPAVATVDASGRVTARKAGTAVITSSTNGVSAQSEIRVQGDGDRIAGVARYQDKEYNAGGFTDNAPHRAIRFAVVELIDDGGRVLSSGRSNADGAYDLGAVWPNRFRVRVLAVAKPQNGTQEARVADNSGAVYAAARQATWDDTDLSLTLRASDEPAGAFNILDVMQRGFEMVNARGPGLPDRLSAYWQPNNDYGTYYCLGDSVADCPQGEGIYVANGPDRFGVFDPDEFDDDVLWHEFGHFVGAALSRDDSPGGDHELGKPTGDLRLAWSEGWGDYFAVAVKAWLSDTQQAAALSAAAGMPLSAYVDTTSGNNILYFDLGIAYSESGYNYADSEMAVARILWNMDRLGYADTLFKVVSSPLVWGSPYPMNLETVWDVWLGSAPAANEEAALAETFRERGVDYTPDEGEPDQTLDTARELTPGVGLVRTLYRAGTLANPSADQDFFWFDVTVGAPFVVETFALVNGANTHLRLLDGSGAPISVQGGVLENDDNSGLTEPKAARLSFNAPYSGRVYAEISGSPKLTRKEGRYGGYTVRLLAQ